MKSKIQFKAFTLLLATVILIGMLAAFVSAAGELAFNQTSVSLAANHGTTSSFTFFLSNTVSDQNITNTGFSATSLTGTDTIASGNITLPSTITIISNGSSSSVKTISIAVPSYQAAGTYTGTITASGTLTNSTAVTAALSVSLTVNSTSSLSLSTPTEVNKANNKTSLTITNNGNIDLSGIALAYNTVAIKDSAGRQATLSFSDNNFALTKGQSKTINISSTIPSNLDVNEYSTTINATASSGTTASTTLKLISDYCEFGKNGTYVEILNLKDTSSEDEWEWKPLDEVTLEIKVRNNGPDEEDITIEIGLYDPEEQEFVDLEGDTEKTVSVEDGKSETEEFIIKVPADISDINHRLYVRAYYENDEEGQCTDRFDSAPYETIKIDKLSRDVVVSNMEIPLSANCGETVEINARVYNVGERDEDKVYVRLYNKELNINQNSNSFSLDAGDNKLVTFSVDISKNATKKDYSLEFKTFYNYDEDDDKYRKSSDTFTGKLKVEGDCIVAGREEKDVSISASLVPESAIIVAGGEMQVEIELENTGDITTTYTISATDYAGWATLESIEPTSLTLDKGESDTVALKLKINSDATGENTFKVKVAYDSASKEQPLSVTVEKSGFGITGAAILENIKGNWLTWLLVLINVIIILAIIIVAVKVSRRA